MLYRVLCAHSCFAALGHLSWKLLHLVKYSVCVHTIPGQQPTAGGIRGCCLRVNVSGICCVEPHWNILLEVKPQVQWNQIVLEQAVSIRPCQVKSFPVQSSQKLCSNKKTLNSLCVGVHMPVSYTVSFLNKNFLLIVQGKGVFSCTCLISLYLISALPGCYGLR